MDVITQAQHQRFEYLFLINGRVGLDCLPCVGVGHDEILRKQRAARHQLPCPVERQAAAVKHQLVVAAHEIAIDQ